MMITNKEEFETRVSGDLEEFFYNNPNGAKLYLEDNLTFVHFLPLKRPILEALKGDRIFLTKLGSHPEDLKEFEAKISTTSSFQEENSGEHSMGGVKLTKSKPGVPMMFDWGNNNNGFSNYLMLAGLAFSIQLVLTLICIFFYK